MIRLIDFIERKKIYTYTHTETHRETERQALRERNRSKDRKEGVDQMTYYRNHQGRNT